MAAAEKTEIYKRKKAFIRIIGKGEGGIGQQTSGFSVSIYGIFPHRKAAQADMLCPVGHGSTVVETTVFFLCRKTTFHNWTPFLTLSESGGKTKFPCLHHNRFYKKIQILEIFCRQAV